MCNCMYLIGQHSSHISSKMSFPLNIACDCISQCMPLVSVLRVLCPKGQRWIYTADRLLFITLFVPVNFPWPGHLVRLHLAKNLSLAKNLIVLSLPNKCVRAGQSYLSPYHKTIPNIQCYQSKRTLSSHLIPLDLLLSCTSCLSPWSISCVSTTAKRKVYYTVGTIAHNGLLFWLDVVERSLVRHISSTIMSHPAISIPFYLLSLSLSLSACILFVQPLTLFLPLPLLFYIIYPSRWEYFHPSSRLAVREKAGFSLGKYFGTERAMIRPSVVFLPVQFQSV